MLQGLIIVSTIEPQRIRQESSKMRIILALKQPETIECASDHENSALQEKLLAETKV